MLSLSNVVACQSRQRNNEGQIAIPTSSACARAARSGPVYSDNHMKSEAEVSCKEENLNGLRV